MGKTSVKKVAIAGKKSYCNEIINDDGSLLTMGRPAERPINGLNSIDGDLDVNEATLKARLDAKKELDIKFAELQELICQVRREFKVLNNERKNE
ncbi:MAG: hypothetical protein PVH64_02760 [Bacillota bacterium]|jgi:hypothetical protein